MFLYADNATLYAPIKRSTDERNAVAASLNRDLSKMHSWANKWKVTFESSKCKAMILSRKKLPSHLDLYLGTCSCRISIEDKLDILGVTFDIKSIWSKHLSTIACRAGQRLGALRKVASKLDTKGRAAVYKAQIHSVVEYACLSWMNASPTNLSVFDNIQKKALKIIGVDEATARDMFSIPS